MTADPDVILLIYGEFNDTRNEAPIGSGGRRAIFNSTTATNFRH